MIMDRHTTYTSDVAFTDVVKAIQTRKGSRDAYACMEQGGSWERLITAELKAEIEEANERLKMEYPEMQGRHRTFLIDTLPPKLKLQMEERMKE